MAGDRPGEVASALLAERVALGAEQQPVASRAKDQQLGGQVDPVAAIILDLEARFVPSALGDAGAGGGQLPVERRRSGQALEPAVIKPALGRARGDSAESAPERISARDLALLDQLGE